MYSVPQPTLESSYMALGSTWSYGAERILLVKYSPAGNLIWSKTVYDPALPSANFHATDICAAPYTSSSGTPPPPASTQPITGGAEVTGYEDSDMYITGYMQSGSANRKMILIRVNASGNVVWIKDDFTPAALDETGVSVESEPGGDVFVVGNASDYSVSPYASHVSAARLNSSGTVVVWFNRYRLNTNGLAYVPRQSCVYRDQQGYVGLGITGFYEDRGNPFTSDAFTLRINPQGTEGWRIGCPSGGAFSSGEDILLDSVSRRFVIAGSSTGSAGRSAYFYQVNAGGNLFPGVTVSPSQGGEMFAQGICKESGGGTNYVLTGEYRSSPTVSGSTFLMNLNPGTGALWTKNYQLTTTNNTATESVYKKVAGYFITTNAFDLFNNFGPDAHVIATDPSGTVAFFCNPDDISTMFATAGSRVLLTGAPDAVSAPDPVKVISDSIVGASSDVCLPPTGPCSCLDEMEIDVTTSCCIRGTQLVYVTNLHIDDPAGCSLPILAKWISWDFSNLGMSYSVTGGSPTSNTVQITTPGPGPMDICVYVEYLFPEGLTCERKICTKVYVPCVSPKPCGVGPGGTEPRSEATTTDEIHVYPNPVSDVLTITLPANSTVREIHLLAADGRIVKSPASGTGTFQADLSGLPAGAYLLRIVSADGSVQVKKIIKN